MALTYSRDATSRPLRVLEELICEIRNGEFSPDSTRSGRLKNSAAQVEKSQGLETVQAENPFDAIEISDSSDSDGMGTHCTTDSSSESGDECVVDPRRLMNGFAVPKGANLWQHQRLKTLHLTKEGHVNFFLRGRKRSVLFHEVGCKTKGLTFLSVVSVSVAKLFSTNMVGVVKIEELLICVRSC